MILRERKATGALLACVFLWALWSLTTNRHVTDLRPVGITEAHPGGTATIEYVGTETKVCDGRVHRSITDSTGAFHDLPDADVFRLPFHDLNKKVTFWHEFPVPWKVAPGPATYHSEVVRYCNFLQWLVWPSVERYHIKFNVTAATRPE